MQIIPHCEVHHLIRQGSDHTPLYVTGNTAQIQVKKYFRFLNFWTKHKDFHKIVQEIWKENIMGSLFHIVHEKLKRVKNALVVWSKETYGDIFQKMATLEDVIKAKESQFQIQPLLENREELSKTEADLKRMLKIEEEF